MEDLAVGIVEGVLVIKRNKRDVKKDKERPGRESRSFHRFYQLCSSTIPQPWIGCIIYTVFVSSCETKFVGGEKRYVWIGIGITG